MVLAESDEEIPLIITVETDSSNDVSPASSTKLKEDDFESSDVSVASSTELKVDDFEPGDVNVVSSPKTNGNESDQDIVEEISLVSSNARNNAASSDQQEERQPKPNEEDLSDVSPSEKETEKETHSIKECNEGLSLVSPSEIEEDIKGKTSTAEPDDELDHGAMPPTEVTSETNSTAEPNDELDHSAMPPTDVTSHAPMSPSEDEVDVPLITFRTFILGPLTNIVVAAMHQLFSYRNRGLLLTKSLIQLMLLIVGKFLAAKLPKNVVRFPGTTIEFSMNPGPFQIKEHVLISILATSGMDSSQSLPVINVMRKFFHKRITFLPAFILVQSNQVDFCLRKSMRHKKIDNVHYFSLTW